MIHALALQLSSVNLERGWYLKTLAPIALFVYNRVQHTRLTVESLLRNAEAAESDLHIFSDGPKNESDVHDVDSVRDFLSTVAGFQSVTIHSRETNFGLSNSIISGVSQILRDSGQVIVLEDDLVTSPYFLNFMNQGLKKYQDDDRVASIHGYVYPCKRKLPDNFFIRGADCWGWATWSGAWNLFRSDAASLAEEIRLRKLSRVFNFNGNADFMRMLDLQAAGGIDSWAIRWNATVFLEGLLTLYPGRSLVANIGNDGSGTHNGATDEFDNELCFEEISIIDVPVQESAKARNQFAKFFLSAKRRKIAKKFFNTLRGDN